MDPKSLPAFPVPLTQGEGWHEMAPCDGMTLRDYFAAKAMREADWSANTAEAWAKWAYKVADAMLAAR